MKKFIINCDFGGQIAPFAFYIGTPKEGNHPLFNQSNWLQTQRGGVVPPDVMNAIERLGFLARKNDVPLEELCVYAMGGEHDNNQPAEFSEEISEDQLQAAHQDLDIDDANIEEESNAANEANLLNRGGDNFSEEQRQLHNGDELGDKIESPQEQDNPPELEQTNHNLDENVPNNQNSTENEEGSFDAHHSNQPSKNNTADSPIIEQSKEANNLEYEENLLNVQNQSIQNVKATNSLEEENSQSLGQDIINKNIEPDIDQTDTNAKVEYADDIITADGVSTKLISATSENYQIKNGSDKSESSEKFSASKQELVGEIGETGDVEFSKSTIDRSNDLSKQTSDEFADDYIVTAEGAKKLIDTSSDKSQIAQVGDEEGISSQIAKTQQQKVSAEENPVENGVYNLKDPSQNNNFEPDSSNYNAETRSEDAQKDWTINEKEDRNLKNLDTANITQDPKHAESPLKNPQENLDDVLPNDDNALTTPNQLDANTHTSNSVTRKLENIEESNLGDVEDDIEEVTSFISSSNSEKD